LGFTKPIKLFLKSDTKNSLNPLGKTAHYDPENFSITIFISGRHPKDILRSFSHELVHHAQNCDGILDSETVTGEGYAQKNPQLRELEREAFEKGNMIFRDWEDSQKAKSTSVVEQRLLKLYQKLLK
jgi:hypothetical protein